MLKRINYLSGLINANWRTHLLGVKKTLFLAGMMFVQNVIFFMLWAVFFHSFSQIKGWHFADVAILIGCSSFSIGTGIFFCDGICTLARHIEEGTLDGFLTKPRHPLPLLMFSRSNAASLGDMITGPIYWIWFGKVSLMKFLLLLTVSLLAAVIFVAIMIVIYSLAFWLKNNSRFSAQLREVMYIFSTIPQHGQGMVVKIIMFTILPAGFISLLPVQLTQQFDLSLFLALIAAAAIYLFLAIAIFNRGLNYYRGWV